MTYAILLAHDTLTGWPAPHLTHERGIDALNHLVAIQRAQPGARGVLMVDTAELGTAPQWRSEWAGKSLEDQYKALCDA